MSLPALDDATFDELYKWLDSVPFSKPRRNISRDFSDGVLVAELISYFVPNIIDIHNYVAANASIHKRYNWETLNRKVFPRLSLHMTSQQMHQLIAMKPGAAEFFLLILRPKIDLAVCQRERNWRMRSTSATRHGTEDPTNNATTTTATTVYANGLSANSNATTSIPFNSQIDTDKEQLPQNNKSPFSTMTNPRRNSRTITVNSANSSPRRTGPVHRSSSSSGALYPEDMVPARLLDEAKQTILKKNEMIQVLQARMEHLEKLVELKQERISQLNRRLEQITQANIKSAKALSEQQQ